MIDFMAQYTLDQFIVYTVALIGVVILIIKTFDYLNDRFGWVDTKHTKSKRVVEDINSKIDQLLDDNKTQQEELHNLVESDQSRIRAEITRCWQQHSKDKRIDYFTLDYLRKQYDCYRAEGGNPHVAKMMAEIDTWEVY